VPEAERLIEEADLNSLYYDLWPGEIRPVLALWSCSLLYFWIRLGDLKVTCGFCHELEVGRPVSSQFQLFSGSILIGDNWGDGKMLVPQLLGQPWSFGLVGVNLWAGYCDMISEGISTVFGNITPFCWWNSFLFLELVNRHACAHPSHGFPPKKNHNLTMSFLVNFPPIFAYDNTSKLTILLVNHPSSLAFWMDCSHTLCGFLAFLAFDGARIYDIYKWKKDIERRLKPHVHLYIYNYIYLYNLYNA
jgi:hypothetical protein